MKTLVDNEATVGEKAMAGFFLLPIGKFGKAGKLVKEYDGFKVNSKGEVPAKKSKSSGDGAKSVDNPKTRLPRNNGHWNGEPGNGKWYSDKPEVQKVTNGKGVEFKDGRPNFTPWSKGSIKFKEGLLKKVDVKGDTDFIETLKELYLIGG
ncbi:hypothetical protein ACFQ4N_16525 [Oceanobacillus iheyensis]|uniref:hypothetical protein n=1 Tax=Oceanobacillus iheyensis TaxID=182710 RepID=UPI0036415417